MGRPKSGARNIVGREAHPRRERSPPHRAAGRDPSTARRARDSRRRDDVDGKRRLGQHAQADDDAQTERPARRREALRAHERVERERHHSAQGDVELKVGSEKTMKGAVPRRNAAQRTYLRVGQAAPEAVEAIAKPKKPIITACAVRGAMGRTR